MANACWNALRVNSADICHRAQVESTHVATMRGNSQVCHKGKIFLLEVSCILVCPMDCISTARRTAGKTTKSNFYSSSSSSYWYRLARKQTVRQALAAGKHVIEEKPVAGDTRAAADAIAEYRAMSKPAPLWM